ncbi:hypothetical protein BOX15_Mlig032497g1 [Macrostomum lignano]|uniref:Serine/threonine-protein phosphatase n=1 Tax=Macrostomum lignano TaxID=282301 RepID=A0A267F710_9PLAT|nr:hypothetical protein BOX15_Mlig032497g1 [Macrostomum lignano]
MSAISQGRGRTSIRAIVLIQSWYRRYKARLEARRRAEWKIYEKIEYASERNRIHLQNFLEDLLELGAELSAGGIDCSFVQRLQEFKSVSIQPKQDNISLASFEDFDVEDSYSGPRLTFPLSATQVQTLIDHFSQGGRLHARYVMQLLHEVRLELKTRPNIYRLSTSISKQVTVVGDLHGQLEDLLLIFYKNGLPDVTNPYVFNGDIVDRGSNSVEVALLLFACQLVWPTAVFINRGNHEDATINIRYGFTDEVQTKYQDTFPKIIGLFNEVFSWLPIATMIDGSIFVVHGGISDSVDLGLLDKLDRHKYYSLIPGSGNKAVNKMEQQQIIDVLWSDPQPELGCQFNNERNIGCFFGPDITANFLQRNRLNLLVRSHQVPIDGYCYTHCECVLTIFSASNYQFEGSNPGAYVKLASNGKPEIVQFCPSKKNLKPLGRQIFCAEDAALRSLRAKIAASKTELVATFSKMDPRKTGCVTVAQWCSAMESELKFDLPWRMLRPHLAELTADKRVMYMTTFQRATLQNSMENTFFPLPDASVMEAVYKNKEELEAIFRIMDRDNSGYISLDEFKECCRVLGRATKRNLPEAEIVDMAKAMDLNKDGRIDFNEFLEAFRIVEFKNK